MPQTLYGLGQFYFGICSALVLAAGLVLGLSGDVVQGYICCGAGAVCALLLVLDLAR